MSNVRAIIFLLVALLAATFAQASRDTALVLKTSAGNIYGTLRLAFKKTAAPVVLIIPGSGPTDRNGNNLHQVNDAYKALADSLSAHGISSLRYDKRGIGESKSVAPDEKNLRFDNYVDDALGWIELLRKMPQAGSVFILGHDEGALIGTLAAKRAAGVRGFISIAGPAFPADTNILQQLEDAHQMPQPMLDSVRMYFRAVREGNNLQSVPRPYYPIFRPAILPFMKSWIKYNPLREIAGLKIPVLLLQGVNDLEIPPAAIDRLKEAAPNAEAIRVEGMNHIFRNAPAARTENFDTYTLPSLPINGTLISAIILFVSRHRQSL